MGQSEYYHRLVMLDSPFDLGEVKGLIVQDIQYLNPDLYKLPEISSKMIQDTWHDMFHVYRGKVINSLSRIATLATMDRHLFFSPYQTECQDYITCAPPTAGLL